MPHKTVAKALIQPNAKTPQACVSKRADHKHLRICVEKSHWQLPHSRGRSPLSAEENEVTSTALVLPKYFRKSLISSIDINFCLLQS